MEALDLLVAEDSDFFSGMRAAECFAAQVNLGTLLMTS